MLILAVATTPRHTHSYIHPHLVESAKMCVLTQVCGMATMQITLIMDGDNFDSGGNMHSNYNATNVKMTGDSTTATTIYEWVQLIVISAATRNTIATMHAKALVCIPWVFRFKVRTIAHIVCKYVCVVALRCILYGTFFCRSVLIEICAMFLVRTNALDNCKLVSNQYSF